MDEKISVCSELPNIVFFKDNLDEIELDGPSEEIEVFIKADRPGNFEKYVSVRVQDKPMIEIDVTLKAQVELLPRIEHLGIAVRKAKNYFSQMLEAQKPADSCIQIEISGINEV